MASKSKPWDPHEGQSVVELRCNCIGSTLVLASRAADWKCGRCRRAGTRTGLSVKLGVDGALPANWREHADQR